MAGRISYYGGIVKDGLILDLDAAKKDSYPGSGTVWGDIAGSSVVGTLINGPTFSSGNGGSIVFDGVDDGVNLSSTITLGNGNWTVSMWSYANSFPTSFGRLLSNNNSGPVSNAFGMASGKISYHSYLVSWTQQLGNTTLNIGNWYNLVWVNTSGSMVMYVNGVVDSNSFTSTTSNGGPINCIGKNWVNSFSGRVATTQIYNRALIQSEITQNYNALKGRYGL
jgi:hypothetical protein